MTIQYHTLSRKMQQYNYILVKHAWRVDEIGNKNKIPVGRKKWCPVKDFLSFLPTQNDD